MTSGMPLASACHIASPSIAVATAKPLSPR